MVDAGVALEVVTVETDRHPSAVDDLDVAELAVATSYEAWHVDTRVTPWRALRGLALESYNVQRFFNDQGEALVRRRLAAHQFDAVIIDSLYVTPYLPIVRQATSAPVILRTQNVEHDIWRTMADNASGPRSLYLRHLANGLHRYELRILGEVDAVAAISTADQLRLQELVPPTTPVALVEVAMAPRYQPVAHLSTAPFGSIASYDWAPNLEGMQWFLSEVWPLVRRRLPEARLDLAGWRSELHDGRFSRPGVTVVGPVASAQEFLSSHSVILAPLLSGGGMRIKLAESMLLAKPIVTTPVGGMGLYDDPDWPLLVREDPEGFAEAVARLAGDPDLASRMGAAARERAAARFSPEVVSGAMIDLIDQARNGTSSVRR